MVLNEFPFSTFDWGLFKYDISLFWAFLDPHPTHPVSKNQYYTEEFFGITRPGRKSFYKVSRPRQNSFYEVARTGRNSAKTDVFDLLTQ